MPDERWYRDGEPIWREPDDAPVTRWVKPWEVEPKPPVLVVVRAEPEGPQLPESTDEAIAAPGPSYAGPEPIPERPPSNPARLRAIARVLRAALEGGTDDAA